LLRLRDEQPFTFQHSINVAYLTAEICLAKAPKNNINDVVMGALLHDIGKLEIPIRILTKVKKLTDKEFDEIHKHTLYGYEMIKDTDLPQITKDIVLHHHEKNDGSGYPSHLAGEEIDDDIKLVTMCDVYDALTEQRCYRPDTIYHAIDAFEILCVSNLSKDLTMLLLALCPDR
jgi:putative nucleotidyltransferase with HDIG domain